MNPFDLLVDDDNDDPNQLIAKLPAIVAAPASATKKSLAPAKPAAKLPSKPLPPAQAVQEAKTNGQRGGGRFGGRGGRGGRGFNRDSPANNENSYGTNNGFNGSYNRPSEDGDAEKSSERRSGYGGPRGGYRGGRRGGYTNGDAVDGERPRRVFDRHSGTGRGNDFKREGAGRGNWGTATDEIAVEPEEPVVEGEKNVEPEKPAGQEDGVDANKENPVSEVEEKEPEEKEMTLEEYEKVLEEKRKVLQGLKSEERKVALDKDLAKMQLLINKKSEEDIFVKRGSEKDKRKEAADKEEKAKKSLSINEFLKPAEGERYYSSGGRGGRGRGRGPRVGYGGGHRMNDVAAPAIGDAVNMVNASNRVCVRTQWNIDIISGITDRAIAVHPTSSDGADLGIHYLDPNGSFAWHFCGDRVTYHAYIFWNSRFENVTVFDRQIQSHCSRNRECYWLVRLDGIYFSATNNPFPHGWQKYYE
ncbi:hypothetical protein R6Q57_023249 [Mikania cordata]